MLKVKEKDGLGMNFA